MASKKLSQQIYSQSFHDTTETIEVVAKIKNRIIKTVGAMADIISEEVVDDDEIDEQYRISYLAKRVRSQLDRYARNYTKLIRHQFHEPEASVETENVEAYLPFVNAGKWVSKLNLNTASIRELEKLSGIGKRTAQQIIACRSELGQFQALSQLEQFGFNEKVLDSLKQNAFCGQSAIASLGGKDLDDLLSDPTFGHLTLYIAKSGEPIYWNGEDYASIGEWLDSETKLVLDEMKSTPPKRRYIKASAVARREKEIMTADFSHEPTYKVDHGALLYDGDYLPFVEHLTASAQKSIYVIMFFLRFEDDRKYPTDDLVANIITKSKARTDVRVILDVDAEGDVVGSRFINANVYNELLSEKVPVLLDEEGKMTHSKLVIVDGQHVVVGSHNWTSGSFYSYDDVSIYLNSKEIAAEYTARFMKLWEKYDSKKTQPINQPVICIEEDGEGRNILFKDIATEQLMTRSEFCTKIAAGDYPGYHIRTIRGVRTPVSNPNVVVSDNLQPS